MLAISIPVASLNASPMRCGSGPLAKSEVQLAWVALCVSDELLQRVCRSSRRDNQHERGRSNRNDGNEVPDRIVSSVLCTKLGNDMRWSIREKQGVAVGCGCHEGFRPTNVPPPGRLSTMTGCFK